jgi:hypothetical protein
MSVLCKEIQNHHQQMVQCMSLLCPCSLVNNLPKMKGVYLFRPGILKNSFCFICLKRNIFNSLLQKPQFGAVIRLCIIGFYFFYQMYEIIYLFHQNEKGCTIDVLQHILMMRILKYKFLLFRPL